MAQLQDYFKILEHIIETDNTNNIKKIICSYYEYCPRLPSEPIHPTISYKPSIEETVAYLEKKRNYNENLEVYKLQIDTYTQDLKNFKNVLEEFIKQNTGFHKLSPTAKELIETATFNDIESKKDIFCKYYTAMHDRFIVYVNIVNVLSQDIS